MFNLIKFEFMKIAKKRTNIITVLVSLILTIIFFTLPAINFYYSGEKGFKAIASARKDMKNYPSKLTEDQVTKDIKEYQSLLLNPQNVIKDANGNKSLKEEVNDKYVSPKFDYLWILADNYTRPGAETKISDLLKLKLKENAKFYKTRDDNVLKLLNENHEGRNYT